VLSPAVGLHGPRFPGPVTSLLFTSLLCAFLSLSAMNKMIGTECAWCEWTANADREAACDCISATRVQRLALKPKGALLAHGIVLALRIDSNRFILGRIDSNRNDSDSISGRIANRIGMNQNATSSVEHPPMTNVQTHTDFVARACSSVGTSAA
jgi:hypothetical protein